MCSSCTQGHKELLVTQKVFADAFHLFFAFSVICLLGGGCGSGSGGKIEAVNSTAAAGQPNEYQSTSTPDSNVITSPTTSTQTTVPGGMTLMWAAPEKYTDATTINRGDLKEYRVYSSLTPSHYGSYVKVTPYETGDNPTTSIQLNTLIAQLSLSTGTYYFVVTAVDTSGSESDYSNQVMKYIQQ